MLREPSRATSEGAVSSGPAMEAPASVRIPPVPAQNDGVPAEVGVDELLAHSEWLRRLALGLARGVVDPEDLVQATYVTALRQPNRGDLTPRRWLAQVLRNVWRMRVRSDMRRAAREGEFMAATYPEGAPSAEALFERARGRRLLAELVAELDEPYRSTVLMRFHEGLSSAEIARREGVPAGTVRWRLMTGLDRLRQSLDEKCEGDRERWVVALLPPLLPPLASWWRAPAKTGLLMGAATAAAIGAAIVGLTLRGPAAQPGAPAIDDGESELDIRFMHAVPAPSSDPEPGASGDAARAEPPKPPRGAQPGAEPKGREPREAPKEELAPPPSAPRREPGVVGGTVGGIVGGVLGSGSAPEPPAPRARGTAR